MGSPVAGFEISCREQQKNAAFCEPVFGWSTVGTQLTHEVEIGGGLTVMDCREGVRALYEPGREITTAAPWNSDQKGLFTGLSGKQENATMAMSTDEIENLLSDGLPGARVELEDLMGDGDHYSAHVTYEGFRGLPRIKQHQMVYGALKGKMGGDLHALALKTSVPEGERI